MSTKIYTGFRVKHNNPSLLMRQLKDLQIGYLDDAREIVSKNLPDRFLVSSDQNTIDKIYQDKLLADVVVYFKDDKIIGQYFIHNPELEKVFKNQSWFEDYHYQNQTDAPDELTELSWEQREKDWQFLDIPASDGFSFYLLNPKDIEVFWINVYRAEKKNEDQVVS